MSKPEFPIQAVQQNVKRLMDEHGDKPKPLAQAIGLGETAIRDLLKDDAKGTTGRLLHALAQHYNVSVDQILGIEGLTENIHPLGPRLFIKGEVAAGRWVEAFESPESEWETFTGRPDVNAKEIHRFGLRVSGDSMNEIYPAGTILECVSLFGTAEAIPGKRVIIVRRRESDLCYEATVKELVSIDGVLWARPRSTNPAHQAFRLDQPGDGICEVCITAVVVAATILE